MDMDDSVVLPGGRGYKRLSGNGKSTILKKLNNSRCWVVSGNAVPCVLCLSPCVHLAGLALGVASSSKLCLRLHLPESLFLLPDPCKSFIIMFIIL